MGHHRRRSCIGCHSWPVLHGGTHASRPHEVGSEGALCALPPSHAPAHIETLQGLTERLTDALHARQVSMVVTDFRESASHVNGGVLQAVHHSEAIHAANTNAAKGKKKCAQ